MTPATEKGVSMNTDRPGVAFGRFIHGGLERCARGCRARIVRCDLPDDDENAGHA